MKKLIFAAAVVAISSSAAFAQSAGVGIPNLNVDAYALYNGQNGVTAYAQAYRAQKVHHVTKTPAGKRAAVGQPSKL
jgi:hypothetical protein